MRTHLFKSHEEVSSAIADMLIETLKETPTACIMLTSGDTPMRAYEILVEKADPYLFKDAFIIGLDEWVGISREHKGGCTYMVDQTVIKPLGLQKHQYTFFDATSVDLMAECKRVDLEIKKRGGFDLALVGLGLNGHIGLNEPGSSFEAYCQITELEEITASVGQKYFQSNTVLTQGITVGLKHLLEAKKTVIMATGPKKAEIISKVVASEPNEVLPASFIHLHKNGHIHLDEAAATLL
jgi:glucosamine-6-phosphate isomerase